MRTRHPSKIVGYLCILSIPGFLLAATGEPASASRQPSLDELLGIPSNWSVAPTDPQTPVESEPLVDPEVERRLTGQETADLFEQVLEMMGDASQRLGVKRDPGIQTQRIQEAAMKKLDQVIAEAEQRCAAGGGSGQKPKKAESGSARNAGPGRSGPAGQLSNMPHQGGASPGHVKQVDAARPIEQHRREWGHLPPRLRDELQQGLGEPYSPLYQSLTEAYFRRLAQMGE